MSQSIRKSNLVNATKINDNEKIHVYHPFDILSEGSGVALSKYQRPIDKKKVTAIMKAYNSSLETGRNISFGIWTGCISISPDGKPIINIIDGQHRLMAYIKLYNQAKHTLPNFVLHLHKINSPNEELELFRAINRADVVPDIYFNPVSRASLDYIIKKYKDERIGEKRYTAKHPRESMDLVYREHIAEIIYDQRIEKTKMDALEKYFFWFWDTINEILLSNIKTFQGFKYDPNNKSIVAMYKQNVCRAIKSLTDEFERDILDIFVRLHAYKRDKILSTFCEATNHNNIMIGSFAYKRSSCLILMERLKELFWKHIDTKIL